MSDAPPEESGSLSRRTTLRLAAASAAAVAATPTPARATAGAGTVRVSRSFDEDWLFHLGDPAGAEHVAYDDGDWRRLDVPHDWRIEDLATAASTDGRATADPSLLAFRTRPSTDGTPPVSIGPFDSLGADQPEVRLAPPGGAQGYTVSSVGWYRKHFHVARSSSTPRVVLQLDGVFFRSDIFVNGQHVHRQAYGYGSFEVDVTDHVVPGSGNVVAVRADNSGNCGRWYTGSGIYRHTRILRTAEVYVPTGGVVVSTPLVGRRTVVQTQVEVTTSARRTASCVVAVDVLDRHGRVLASSSSRPRSVRAGRTTHFALRHALTDPEVWELDDPALHIARVRVLDEDGRELDGVEQAFGIREIEWSALRGFVLNGRRVQILGGCIHHDHGPLGAVSLARSEERRIEVLKAAGFNAVRLAHCPASPALLEACDRLGMLVCDEFTDVWDVPNKGFNDYHVEFPDQWRSDLRDWMRRDRNHPSVIMWSIGNEIVADPQGYGPRLATAVRDIDTSRPVVVGGFTRQTSLFDLASDPYWEYVDVGDVHYSTDVTAVHEAHPELPMTRSESYPTTMYADWAFDRAHHWMAGTWVWAAWDFIGESGAGAPVTVPVDSPPIEQLTGNLPVLGATPYPWYVNSQSDFDLIGQPRAQHAWRRVIYGLSPIELAVERPAPEGMEQRAVSWSYFDELPSWTWDVEPGRLMRVRVYAAGDRVELRLDGVRIGSAALATEDQMVTTFDVPWRPGRLEAVTSRRGRVVGRATLETVGRPHGLRLTSDVPRLTTGRDDLAHVLVDVVDSQGRAVPDALEHVHVSVQGAGSLMGLANGNPHNVDTFQGPARWTFHGKVLAVVRPSKAPGRVTVLAEAPGLEPTRLSLSVGQG